MSLLSMFSKHKFFIIQLYMTFKLDNEQVHFKVKDNKDNIKKALFLGLSLLANIRNQCRSFLLDSLPTRLFLPL